VTLRRIHLFFAISLAIHAMMAAIPLSRKLGEGDSAGAPLPMVVRLMEMPKSPEPSPLPPEPVVPQPKSRPEPVRTLPRTQTPAPLSPSPREAQRRIETAEVPARRAEPQFDMLAMINARRERREAAMDAARRYEEAHSGASIAGPKSSELAAINRNLQNMGSNAENTGGVFTILSKGTRTGEFAFNGWRPETNRRWREVIEVDAGPGGNLELAMVRRMIQLIRGHYTGDFTWRSYRLDKSLVLSARPEDSEELEEFLLREFFGTPTLANKR